MRNRIFSIVFMAALLIMGAMGSAHAQSKYLTALSAACPGTSCTNCHPSGGPPPFTAYGNSFDGISSHSSNPAGAVATLGCPGGTTACTGYTYSAWSPATCPASGQQTRTATKTPAGCTGTPPTAAVVTQSCTPAPVACTGYTYSAWSPATCPASGQQTRTATKAPAGCTGTPSTAAVLTQACTPATAACTGFTYSAWSPSACAASGQQTRTATNAPAGCTGTPVTTQTCNYVPPSSGMGAPVSKMLLPYPPLLTPVISMNPTQAMPISVGAVAQGGNTLTVQATLGQFLSPMDVYAAYGISTQPDTLHVLKADSSVQTFSYWDILQGGCNRSPSGRSRALEEQHYGPDKRGP